MDREVRLLVRIMICGGRGMLGRQVVRAAEAAGHDPVSPVLDITDSTAIIQALLLIRPDWVINCAGIVPDRGATWERMASVNGVGPWLLTKACELTGIKLLQVSTDCVWSGKLQARPYSVLFAFPDATDPYGLSKRLGERGDLVVRCSFVGHGEHGTLAWLQREVAAGTREVDGWLNTAWNGGTAPTVARALIGLVEKGLPTAIPQGRVSDFTYRVHHLATREIITKAELLRRLIRAFDLPLTVRDVYEPNPPRYLALEPTILLPDLDESIAELARDG